ncbi:hypothetical protein AAC387_Pa11g2150 [Persea americana]
MEDGNTSRSHLKRPLPQDDEDDPHRPPMQKRPRFPKGKKDAKKVKTDDGLEEAGPIDRPDPRFAANERAMRRKQITKELIIDQSSAALQDVTAGEVNYEDNDHFEDDGTLYEPFNLNQEREEGYFDAQGNFVEYVKENEIKDAWLDSVDVEPRFDEKRSLKTSEDEEIRDLSADDIGKIKRRITNVLHSGETILQALRRLKGISTGKKGKMPEHIKCTFDQLTEDSMKLMENGDYNVYHDEREVFEREAEGYERIARAREGTTMSVTNGTLDPHVREDIFSGGSGTGVGLFPVSELPAGDSNLNMPTAHASSGNDGDGFDMFGEDDENTTSNLPINGDGLGPQPATESVVSSQNMESEGGGTELETDYVFDESSGYYYSSTLGYYYDPTSGLYCCATSGTWYSFNEQSGTYEEIRAEAMTDAAIQGESS